MRKYVNRKGRNKRAFNEVIEQYIDMHTKSTTRVLDMSQPAGAASNPASPTMLDFFCDVDNAIKTLDSPKLVNGVITHYFAGEEVLSKSQINYVENYLGELFASRGIWPVSKYFLTVRKKEGK